MSTPIFPSLVAAKYDASQPRIPNPARPLKEGIKTNVLIQTFDSGHEQRRQKSDPKRTFDLSYPVLKSKEYFTIRDFFLQVTNSQAFLWTHPVEKTQHLVRFNMDTFAGEYVEHGPSGPLYKLQLSLLQVWA